VLLSVQLAELAPPTLSFFFVVPGHQIWYPRSFRATASRQPGGFPNRAYTLTITDGTTVVAAVGAVDDGAEPGTCEITWCDTPAAHVAAGAVGVSVAPLGPFMLKPGYVITGAIVGAAAGDTWVDAAAWFDFVYSG
jgi:hypothetical protein